MSDVDAPAPRSASAIREIRRARATLVVLPLLAVGAIVGSRLLATSRTFKLAVAQRIANDMANRTSSTVRIGEMSFGWAYQPCLEDVSLSRPELIGLRLEASAKEACVDRWPSALGSGFRAVRIQLDRPAIEVAARPDQDDEASLVDVSPTRTASLSHLEEDLRKEPLREVEIVFDDLRLDWKNLPLPERLASGVLGPLDGTVTGQRRGRLSALFFSVRDPITGLSANGRAMPTDDGWDITFSIDGDLAPSFGPLLSAATGLDIRALPVRGTVGAIYSRGKKRVTADIDLEQVDVNIANRLVSSRRLVGFEAHQKLQVVVDLEKRRLSIEKGWLEVNGVPILVSLNVEPGESSPAFHLETDLHTISIARLLGSIPGADEGGMLKNVSPNVLFAMTFAVKGELEDPSTWQPQLEHSILGIEEDAEGSGLEHLLGAFEYRPLDDEGRSEPRATGRGTPGWVRYGAVPYPLRRAIQVSEDASFFVHRGVDLAEIQAAIVSAVTNNDRARGGSTITQQLVKNLFLSRERTALRKIQEFLLTLLMESALTKDQIFELYVNLIEWGPNIYGLKPASRHYFRRAPSQLTPKEMAYLATIIPSPLRYHRHFERGRVPDRHLAKVDSLLERLYRLETLSDEEWFDAQTQGIHFGSRRAKAEEKSE